MRLGDRPTSVWVLTGGKKNLLETKEIEMLNSRLRGRNMLTEKTGTMSSYGGRMVSRRCDHVTSCTMDHTRKETAHIYSTGIVC